MIAPQLRHPVSHKPILNRPLCVDDYGSLVFKCQYTGVFVNSEDFIFLGPCVPQVHGTYVCAPGAAPAFRSSKKAFDESEANCNACKNFQRTAHPKRIDGLMLGVCGLTKEPLKVHPDDWMGLSCWEARP